MNVYVETNFLLNLGLHQEGVDAATSILTSAEHGKIDLVIPAMALMEAITTMEAKRRERERVIKDLKDQASQLKRSKNLKPLESIEATIGVLVNLNDNEAVAIQESIQRALSCCRVLSPTAAIMDLGIGAQHDRELQPQDSVIFASIYQDLKSMSTPVPSCFVSTDPDLIGKIFETLKNHNCKCFISFDEAQRYFDATLS